MLGVIRAQAKAQPGRLYFNARFSVYLTGSVSHLKHILTFALLCLSLKKWFLLNPQPPQRRDFFIRKKKHLWWQTADLLQIKIKNRFLWDVNSIHNNTKLCAYVSRHPEEQQLLHFETIYLLFTLVSAHFWQQKVQKERKWMCRCVETLIGLCLIQQSLCKAGSDLTWADSFCCKSWSPLSWFQWADSRNSINLTRGRGSSE